MTDIKAIPFDPDSEQHQHAIYEMYRDYLLEAYGSTGQVAAGLPLAVHLRTLVVVADGEVVAFCAVDAARHAVELIYVVPERRRQGIARMLLAQLAGSCPQQMRAKVPLTPSSEQLMKSLDIPPTVPAAAEERSWDESHEDLRQLLLAYCTHRRPNPSRACRRCYRHHIDLTARTAVQIYVGLYRPRPAT